MDRGVAAATEAAHSIGAQVEPIQTSPDFRRLLLKRQHESIMVDLIREYVFQIDMDKRWVNGIRIDPPEEIFANNLCALLSRSEIRDLVDVRQLEMAGLSLQEALAAAARKDTGLTPAQLAWVLEQIDLRDTSVLPGGVEVRDLASYLDDLITRLQFLALPDPHD